MTFGKKKNNEPLYTETVLGNIEKLTTPLNEDNDDNLDNNAEKNDHLGDTICAIMENTQLAQEDVGTEINDNVNDNVNADDDNQNDDEKENIDDNFADFLITINGPDEFHGDDHENLG